MVGLQRPQAEPGANEDNEEDSKMVCVAIEDDFVLKQDICVIFSVKTSCAVIC